MALLAPRDAEGTYARRENQAVNQAGRMVVGRLFARPLGGWYRGAWRRRSFSSDGDVYDDDRDCFGSYLGLRGSYTGLS